MAIKTLINSQLKKFKIVYTVDLFFICILMCFIFVISKKLLSHCNCFDYDESLYTSVGDQLLKGAILYKDVFDCKPCVVHIMNALGLFFFGTKNCGFKLISILLVCLAITFFYLTLTRIGIMRRLSLLIALILAFFHLHTGFMHFYIVHNGVEIYGLAFSILAFCSFFWVQNKNPKQLYITHVLGGIFLALAILSKEPFILGLAPLTFFTFFEGTPLKFNKAKFLSMLIGFSSIFSLLLFYLFWNNALISYIDIFFLNIASSKQYAPCIGYPNPTSLKEELSFALKWLNYHKFFQTISPLYPFYLAAIYFNRFNFKTIICLISIFGSLVAFTLGHCFYPNYLLMSFFPFTSLAIVGGKSVSDYFFHLKQKNKYDNFYFFLFMLLVLYPFFVQPLNYFLREWRSYPNYQQEAYDTNAVVLKKKVLPLINKYTQPEDKVLLVGFGSLYIFTDRKPATKYVQPIDCILQIKTNKWSWEERKSDFMDDLEKNDPKVIYLQKEYWACGKLINEAVKPFIEGKNYAKCDHNLYIKRTNYNNDVEQFCTSIRKAG